MVAIMHRYKISGCFCPTATPWPGLRIGVKNQCILISDEDALVLRLSFSQDFYNKPNL